MTNASLSVVVVVPERVMRTSLALTLDILETANRICQARGNERPFSIRECKVGEADLIEKPADIIILPGLGLASEVEYNTALRDGSIDEIMQVIRRLSGPKTQYATSCSGVFAFAHAGLLHGRAVTVTWWLAPLFSRLFPDVTLRPTELVVHDGPVTTSGAALSHADLMLLIVERNAGYAVLRECMRYLVLDERRGQSKYVSVAGLIAGDPKLVKAKRYVQAHMANEITVEHLAASAGLPPRTFARRLSAVAAATPIAFIQQLRIARAVDLALTTGYSADQIALKVGYSDANALRRIMKRQIGETIDSLRN
ncbi:MAG: helix-turn-helix domain-containing protein [Hyphomicrobiales bacterium]|nr:helix-turn-helix domain-containing protein [Hyphomicrobiales bacterium]MCP4998035.1 helix-turn-helix domain-containing protein [Hyphomicrobiales bacterium]